MSPGDAYQACNTNINGDAAENRRPYTAPREYSTERIPPLPSSNAPTQSPLPSTKSVDSPPPREPPPPSKSSPSKKKKKRRKRAGQKKKKNQSGRHRNILPSTLPFSELQIQKFEVGTSDDSRRLWSRRDLPGVPRNIRISTCEAALVTRPRLTFASESRDEVDDRRPTKKAVQMHSSKQQSRVKRVSACPWVNKRYV